MKEKSGRTVSSAKPAKERYEKNFVGMGLDCYEFGVLGARKFLKLVGSNIFNARIYPGLSDEQTIDRR